MVDFGWNEREKGGEMASSYLLKWRHLYRYCFGCIVLNFDHNHTRCGVSETSATAAKHVYTDKSRRKL